MSDAAASPVPRIRVRAVPEDAAAALRAAGVPPLLARLYAARGLRDPAELQEALAALAPPQALHGIDRAAELLADAIASRAPICVVGDYDCDGATATAVAVLGLRMLGAKVDYLVPNRFEYGYGLTPPIVDLALVHPRLGRPAMLVTVDNGIASVEGVDAAHAAGLKVIVTDHHLPGDRLPDADAIVNPNQPGCGFPSKHAAGVAVMFYVLLALRARLRAAGAFGEGAGPALQSLLDLVALGTVADVVRLDRNNRLLVSAGLRRVRQGRARPGLLALMRAGGRDPARITAADLGFVVGPRINAAGRLADMALGIECLLADDPARADALAAKLDEVNRERREIEDGMRMEALADLDAGDFGERRAVVLHRESWHQGVIGLVAARVRERCHRPAFAFAPGDDTGTVLKGSGRSIPGVHLRDAVDLVSKRRPGLIERFGGHAMAAGLTLRRDGLEVFADELDAAVARLADEGCFTPSIDCDGPLSDAELTLESCAQLDDAIWGQGFPPPVFVDDFEVRGQRLVADRHMKLELVRCAAPGAAPLAAIAFRRREPLPARARIVYRLMRDEFRGVAKLSLAVEHVEPLPDAP